MRIAVDLRPLQIGHEYRGIGTYLINILSRLPAGSRHHFIFYQFDISNPLADHNLSKPASYEVIKIPKPIWRRSVGNLLKYVLAGLYPRFPKLAAAKPDVFLQPDFQLGLPKIRGCKKFVVIYDLIPLILNDIYMPPWRKPLFDNTLRWYSRFIVAAKWAFHEKRYYKNLKRLNRAHKVLSISQSTTDDLHKYLSIDKSKIETIPLAPSFRATAGGNQLSQELTTKIDNIHKPFLSFIGGTDARRKIDELIYAFNDINSRWGRVELVLAGNEFRELEQIPNVSARTAIIDSSYKHQIHLLGYLTEAEKEYVLKKTDIFVYPTLYEGFGLPILEAMHAGCPVVAFNNSSIPEVGGDAVAYAPTPDVKGISSVVLDILNNPDKAKAMSKKGVAQVSKFSWDVTAQKTWRAILKT
jgi:glycosyltransferase involved in cell wall biosynthesis